MEYLLDKIKFVILKGKRFTCLATTKLKFMDISNYIAPGFDYSKFIKAYEVEQQKFYWPYEWFQNFQRLDEPILPPHEAFYSSLKKENISQEAYGLCQTVWKDKNWTSMREHLEYYNNLDAEPFYIWSSVGITRSILREFMQWALPNSPISFHFFVMKCDIICWLSFSCISCFAES